MRKLELAVEDLAVESFVIDEEASSYGTVQAMSPNTVDNCQTGGGETCDQVVTCGAGCNTIDAACTYQYATDSDCHCGGWPTLVPANNCQPCVNMSHN